MVLLVYSKETGIQALRFPSYQTRRGTLIQVVVEPNGDKFVLDEGDLSDDINSDMIGRITVDAGVPYESIKTKRAREINDDI